jgi:hypothetical protein
MAQSMMLLTFIRGYIGSDTDYPQVYRSFPQIFQSNTGLILQIKSLKNLPHPFQFLQVLTSRDEPYYMKQSSWNPNVHGSAHNSPLLVSTRSQMNPVHAFPSSNIILWSALRPPIRSLSFCLSYLHTFPSLKHGPSVSFSLTGSL